MATHSPACQQVLAEMLSTPPTSTDHRIAEYVDAHTPAEGFDLVLTVIIEDAREDSRGALRLFPLLNAEVSR